MRLSRLPHHPPPPFSSSPPPPPPPPPPLSPSPPMTQLLFFSLWCEIAGSHRLGLFLCLTAWCEIEIAAHSDKPTTVFTLYITNMQYLWPHFYQLSCPLHSRPFYMPPYNYLSLSLMAHITQMHAAVFILAWEVCTKA